MNKPLASIFAAIAVALAVPTLAQPAAKPAAESVNSTDPIVVMRAEVRAANKRYDEAVSASQKARMTKVNAAVAAAEQQAKTQGKDPLVARRDAKAKAMAATKAEFDAIAKPAAAERNAAQAAARKKAGVAKG